MLATLGGCASRDAGPAVWCRTNAPWMPTAEEYATYDRQRKVEMDAHNTFGEKVCGWAP